MDSGYTQFVGLWWRRGVSAIVLSMFAGLPVSNLVCAIHCAAEATAATAGHHALSVACHEAPLASFTTEAPSHHECEHADREAAAFLRTIQADPTVLLVKQAVIATTHATQNLFVGSTEPRSGAPPGPAQPVRAPLVLRI